MPSPVYTVARSLSNNVIIIAFVAIPPLLNVAVCAPAQESGTGAACASMEPESEPAPFALRLPSRHAVVVFVNSLGVQDAHRYFSTQCSALELREGYLDHSVDFLVALCVICALIIRGATLRK